MKKHVIAACALSALFMVGACSTPVAVQTLPQMSFAHLSALNFDVETVEIDNKYQSPNNANQVENRFPTSPAAAIRTWALDRLKPVGAAGSGKLRVVINHAGVKETNLKVDKSLTGAFTKQQSNRYDLAMDVALEIIDGTGKQVGFSAAKASRSITTGEDISLNDREKRWFEMTENAMGDLDAEMESNIRRYLARWLQ